MLTRWFLDHPRSVGESYFEHQRMAFGFFASLFMASMACLIHGFVPCLFKRTASGTVAKLHDRMIAHRSAGTVPAVSPSKSVQRRPELSRVD